MACLRIGNQKCQTLALESDGYSAFKEITRDGFGDLINAIERGDIDVVIVRDIDRLTRNLTDWNRFEKACVRHGVLLSPYTGADLDLSTPEGAYYGGMETLRAKRESAGQERASARGSRPLRPGGQARRGRAALVRIHPHLRQPR
jgi:DNA invertase Pin-like site-specific DNA recombinase